MRGKVAGLNSGVARQRRVAGLTMAAEVSVHFPARPFGPQRVFPGGGGGELMTGVTVRESVNVAGLVERARAVRSFAGAVLGPGHPCGDDAILLASELFANSLRHSSSGLPGETVTVTAGVAAVRVEVADRSGPGAPELRRAGEDAEDGRGLGIVERLAERWGWRRRGGRTVTWFVIQALLQPMQHPQCPVRAYIRLM
jgi:anti-sigma regulatory factor (Ser/Thr protein kinase)